MITPRGAVFQRGTAFRAAPPAPRPGKSRQFFVYYLILADFLRAKE